MDAERLREVLEKHKKWLNGEDGGEKADLYMEDLCMADMRWEDMRGTDMRRANLYGADLYEADLRGANLDLSCWPLWCGSLDVIVDKRIAAQLAYHFCRIICDDEEVKAAQKALAPIANQFHRVNECGRINAFFCDGELEDRTNRKKVPNCIADVVLETLVLDGPMKTGKIIYKTGLEPRQVYNAVYYLKMRGIIEKEDRKWRVR